MSLKTLVSFVRTGQLILMKLLYFTVFLSQTILLRLLTFLFRVLYVILKFIYIIQLSREYTFIFQS